MADDHMYQADEWANRIRNLIIEAEEDGYEVEVDWDRHWDEVSNPRLIIYPKGTILPSNEEQIWPPKDDE